MSYSFTATEAATFTVVHARHLAAKVKTDLKRMQRLYDKPSDADIDSYESEVVELLRCGYLGTVMYGFKRNDQWIEPTLRYTAQDLAAGVDAADDDPGKVRPGADVAGASFYSYLTYSAKWDSLNSQQQADFKESLAVQRTGAQAPNVNGYFVTDRTYSSGGRSLGRDSVRSYG
ncbi:HORMA-1 domain-containing protein [Azohydromonas caseinilytica]|uniref:Bacterial HORMA domain-containing protein n=1 Tax=Azohydromonas caseinilytica TaxID=2728836 RepID=A0A848FE15_9BURK|nr:hypothetical protein [Azohydromonas caseinilytica]NML17055.1 hypothetical protein [Azohydromonas caseinilytica]